jgi:dihydroxyacetone kinase-like predicted kinase
VGEHKYCTEFILQGAQCSVSELRELLGMKGDSLIVAGEQPTVKVHIHTDNPDGVQALAAKHGELTRMKVDNMEQQHNMLVVDRPKTPYSIAFVVPGAGFDRIARELGAEVTLLAAHNPSVRDLVLAINKCLAQTVYLFVNDKNVLLAAQEAARLSGRAVHVLPTPDILAGLSGLLVMRQAAASAAERDIGEVDVMRGAAQTKTAQVFLAGKGATIGGTTVQRGKPAAASANTLYGGESLAEAAQAALKAMGADGGGLITVYYGGAQKERDAQRLVADLRSAFPTAEADYYYGGQKGAEYWISLDE